MEQNAKSNPAPSTSPPIMEEGSRIVPWKWKTRPNIDYREAMDTRTLYNRNNQLNVFATTGRPRERSATQSLLLGEGAGKRVRDVGRRKLISKPGGPRNCGREERPWLPWAASSPGNFGPRACPWTSTARSGPGFNNFAAARTNFECH